MKNTSTWSGKHPLCSHCTLGRCCAGALPAELQEKFCPVLERIKQKHGNTGNGMPANVFISNAKLQSFINNRLN